MGRGRQKAKQRKVARKLKYYSPETDYEALRREFGAKQAEESEKEWDYDEIPPATDDDWPIGR